MRSIFFVALLFPCVAVAGGIDQLQAFLKQTNGISGLFQQIVLSKSGRKPQQASGTFAMQRPGKFRWSYEKPYRQLLLSDGNKVWSYDPELNQVVVSKLGTMIGGSPAALLAGRDLEKNFELSEGKPADGIDYVEARPKSGDANFERMKIGFSGGQPVNMEIHDNFGQTTQLAFSKLESIASLPASMFHFVVPKGADVVGE